MVFQSLDGQVIVVYCKRGTRELRFITVETIGQ